VLSLHAASEYRIVIDQYIDTYLIAGLIDLVIEREVSFERGLNEYIDINTCTHAKDSEIKCI